MQNIFIGFYNFSLKRKPFFFIILLTILAVIIFSITKIELEENITSIIPHDERIEDINMLLNSSNFSDRVILNFSFNDTSFTEPDTLILFADRIIEKLKLDTTYIKSITYKIDQSLYLSTYDFFYENLPLYLSPNDYNDIKEQLNTENIDKTLKKNFKALMSPTGIATKKYIFQDPLSITPKAIKVLKAFQFDDNFMVYNSCIFTKNHKNMLVFIEPKFPSGNTDVNELFIEFLDKTINKEANKQEYCTVNYYGGTAVAVANSSRIKKDIASTVSIAVMVLLILFFAVFKKLKSLLLLFIPVVLGAGIAISLLIFIEGKLSAIALGVGAILIGISIDFSLHLFTHYRSSRSIVKSIKDIAEPIIMSSLTTASAFLCLFIIKSEALQQLGMFAAISVFAASIFVLTIIPILLSLFNKNSSSYKKGRTLLDKIAEYQFSENKIIVLGIILLTIVFTITSGNLGFNSDISSLNYQTDALIEAERDLKEISTEALSSVYVVSSGQTLEQALEKTENARDFFDKCIKDSLISFKASASDLIVSQKEQENRYKKWAEFWNNQNVDSLKETFIETGKKYHFKNDAFNQFFNLLDKKFKPKSLNKFSALQELFLNNYITKSDSVWYVISVLKTEKENKKQLYSLIDKRASLKVFDKQYFTEKFFDILKEGFSKLVTLSMVIVFAILLVFFGRIELALITYIPIVLSWIWTIGLMGLFSIEFNIFNIIISTFIFGLGIDYSIFIMRGLLSNYKYGNISLSPYKLSILLSVLTTITGIGVLILAKHPALKSIAIVSIFGISSVLIISYTILPLLFNFLVSIKGRKRISPLLFIDFIVSLMSLIVFILGTFLLTLLIPVFYVLPFPVSRKKLLYHYLIYLICNLIVKINLTFKIEYIDKSKFNLSKPKVIISNHQSHLDLVFILMLNPKIIVLTNKWVWNNPFYGLIIKYAGYYPVYEGLDKGYEKIKKKVDDGYSVLVFPEGTRTKNGEIARFHQGAFSLADFLKIDILPIMLHGAYECMPKTEFFLRSGNVTLKFFDKIKVNQVDIDAGITYRFQAKEVTRFYRDEFSQLKEAKAIPQNIAKNLIKDFIYKGPVLEWYLRIKLKLEKNYKFFNDNVPSNSNIVDLGCGYGFLSYILRKASNNRNVLGLDYDKQKIAVAQRIAFEDEKLNFEVKNVIEDDIPYADVYIISDVLHYLPEEEQYKLIEKCISKIGKKGKIIIRDANADLVGRTLGTKITEFCSTKLLKFNKTKFKLSYISAGKIISLAEKNNLKVKIVDNARFTSNIIYIITHEE